MSTDPPFGVLLANLGTPDAPSAAALRRYLRAFLSDPRVVDRPRWRWLPLLYGVIAPLRAPRSAAAYRAIWREDGSPLLVHSERLRARIEQHLGVPVALGMRYGRPSIAGALARLLDAGIGRVVVLPLFPQYSSTTTAAAFDALAAALADRRDLPALRFVRDYADDAGYLDALAARVRAFWDRHGEPDRLLISFHGLPVRYAANGDPYPARCEATADGLRARLGWDAARAPLVYQSRFGREPWLRPYADEVIDRLARDGVRRIDAICPGFAVDCLETIEEVGEQYAARFRAAGGEQWRYIPALNDGDDHARVLGAIVRREAAGWT